MSSATHAHPVSLPAPTQRPHADVVIFDGFCRFCRAQMALLRRIDLFGALAFVSLHDAQSEHFLPGVSFEEKMRAMVVADRNGGRHAGARAMRYLSRRLPLLWWLAPALHIPGSLPVWQRLYDAVARARYRFGRATCDGGTCHLHG